MKIISASRRTDIPAFYGDWFMNRIAEGFAGYINPFNNKKNIVSLKKMDVASIVLWSKNFTPFTNNALTLKDNGYTLFFNYTITGLPEIFEPHSPSESESVDSIKYLSSIFSPDCINWRYDPILISGITGIDYHIDKFTKLCRSLSGSVKRCYISFPTNYGKVERSFKDFSIRTGIYIVDFEIPERINLAKRLSIIAESFNIQLFSCCGDYLISDIIKKGHCIDGSILSSISDKDLSRFKARPTRKECGCTESTDIGIYDSCPHGCVYCYANSNIVKASSFHEKYISDQTSRDSAFLGVSKDKSDSWIKDLKESSDPGKISNNPGISL